MRKNILFILAVSLIFVSCGPNSKYIKRIQSLEEGVTNPTTIAELEDAISKYENRVEDIIAAEAQTGIWYKILATRYMDNKMYGQALKAFQMAIQYYPENQNLYYFVGVCAGYMANAELDYNGTGGSSKRENYLKLAESAYLRAIELENRYARALYGLGVLYVFELDQSEKAIPVLEKLLSIENKHTDGMFVLARAYYVNYDFQKAADMYDKIISTTTSEEKRTEAENNKKTALDMLYLQ
jgi:cytochrome c-type biogenesis protein CcmH/NrfG